MRTAIGWLGAFAVTGMALSGCASQAEQVQGQENLLAAAGFMQRPADTPQRRAELSRLPPDQIVRTVHRGNVVYLYSDPLICNCLYIGDQTAWSKYQQEQIQLRVADEQLTAAEMNENAATNWDWGPWGPGWW